jgi:hypothetical protein
MRHLWKTTLVMVGGGAALIAASIAAGLGPIALVTGALLLWSGIVKLIVLRIWRQTLGAGSSPASTDTASPAHAGGAGPR